MYPWSSWHTLVPLILGAAGLAVFCIYEIYYANFTLFPMGMFLNRSTSLTYLIAFIHGIILWSIVYYMPLYFMAVLSYTPILAGVSALPQTLTVVPSAMVVGLVAAKTGRYRWSLWIGWAIATLGCGLLYLLGVGTSVPAWILLLLVSGIGMGLLFPGMNLSIQASVPPKDMPIAGGLFTFFRAFGQGVGVAMLVSLLLFHAVTKLTIATVAVLSSKIV
jgi:MFS family permease